MTRKIADVIIIILFALVLMYATAHTLRESVYPATMYVWSVDRCADVVTMATESGHEFEFYGVEDIMEGDIMSVLMFDSFTSNIKDDIILDVRYSGF